MGSDSNKRYFLKNQQKIALALNGEKKQAMTMMENYESLHKKL
jgi:hypothetical protein